mgnify:CR=1 FL=1
MTNREGRAFQVNQTASERFSASMSNELQTVTRNVGLLWVEKHQRWMTPSELLLSQGFPVMCASVRDMNLPLTSSFQEEVRGRKRAAQAHQAGNSMNVNTMGYVHLFVGCFVDKIDQTKFAVGQAPKKVRIV